MAFMIKGIIDLKGILFLMLLTVTSKATNLDCNGKAFHCVNSTHFMICVDLGRGTSTTIDDLIIPCPSPTVCRRTNRFECEFPLPSLLSSTIETTEFTTILTTESEVTTFVPLPITSIPFDEYYNTVSTTTLSQTEVQPSPADILLSVKPIIGGLDTSNLSTSEKGITERDINTTPDTVIDNYLSSGTVTPSDNIASNDTVNLNVILNDAISVNNNPITINQAPVTDSSQFVTEYNNLGNSILNDVTSAGSEQKVYTENIYTTEFGPILEKHGTDPTLPESVIISVMPEVPVKISPTEISSAVSEQIVTTEQYFGTRFQDVTTESTVDNATFDTTLVLEINQDVKQINESQLVRDMAKNAGGNFYDVSEVSMNAASIDVTSTVPEQTTEQYSLKSVREFTVNTIVTDYVSTQPDIATPLVPTPEDKIVNATPLPGDTTTHAIDNFSDVNIAQEASTYMVPTAIDQLHIRVTELSVLNINQSTPGNVTPPISTITEPTKNIDPALTEDFTAVSVNTTETISFNTEASVNIIPSLELTSPVTGKNVINSPTQILEDSSNSNNISNIQNTVSNVEEPNADLLNVSKTGNNIDIGSTGLFETNETKSTTTNTIVTVNEFNTLATDFPVSKNFASAVPVTTYTNNVITTDNPNYQEFYQTITSTHNILSHSNSAAEFVTTEPAKRDNKAINASIFENIAKLDNTSTTVELVTIKNKMSDRLNKNLDQNHFNNSYIQTNQADNSTQDKATNSYYELSTTRSTVMELVTETQFETSNNLENASIIIESPTVKTIIEKPIDNERQKPSENATRSTAELNFGTETITTITLNNLEMLTHTTNTTPGDTTRMSTENILNEQQSDAENISNDGNNSVGIIKNILIHNEKVLSTITANYELTTQAYNNSDTGVFSPLINNSTTSTLELIPNDEEKTKLELVDSNKLSGVNIHTELGNELSTESAILFTESLLAKPTVYESSITKKDLNKVNGDNSIISVGSIDTLTDVKIETVTDTSHLEIQTSVKELTDNTISTAEYYKVTVTATEITTLSPPTGIVGENKNLTSELINSLQQSSTTPMNTFTTMAITEAAYVPPDYTLTEKTNNNEETTIYNRNDQIQTETVLLFTQNTDSSKSIIQKNIHESTVNSDVVINIEENVQELHPFTIAQLNNYDTTKQETIVATNTFSEMPSSTDFSLKSLTPSMFESISKIESSAKADENNQSNPSKIENNPSNDAITEKQAGMNLINSSTLASGLVQTHFDQIMAAKDTKTSNVTSDLSSFSNNIDLNSQSATDISFKESSDRSIFSTDSINETTSSNTKSNIENVKSPMESIYSSSSNSPTRDQEPTLTNTKTDLSTQSSTSRNAVATASTHLTIKVPIDVHAMKSTGNSVIKETTVNDGPTTTINHSENVALDITSLGTVNQNKTVSFGAHTQRDINTQPTTQVTTKEVGSLAAAKLPVIVNTANNRNLTIIIDNMNGTVTGDYVNANNSVQQTNPLENITLNTPNLEASRQESHAYNTRTGVDHTVITIGERNEEISTFANSLTSDNNKSINTASGTKSTTEPSRTTTVQIKLTREVSPSLIKSNFNKEEQLTDLRPGLVTLVTSSIETTTLSTSDNLNSQKSNSLLTGPSANLVSVNPNTVTQFETKPMEKEALNTAEFIHTLVNNNHNIKNTNMSTDDNKTLLPVNSKSIATKPILTSETLPIKLDVSPKRSGETISADAASTISINIVDPTPISTLPLSQIESTQRSINSEQMYLIPSMDRTGPVTDTSYVSFDINHQVTTDTAHVANIEPTTESVRRNLATTDDSQVFIDNKQTKVDDKILTAPTFGPRHSTEIAKTAASTNIEYNTSNTEKATTEDSTRNSTIQITVSGVELIKSINNKSTPDSSLRSSDIGVPTKDVVSDVLINSNIESKKTHSGIISFITQLPKLHEPKEKKEKPEIKEQQEHPMNVELVSFQDNILLTQYTAAPVPAQNNNGDKFPKDTRQELIKNENNNFKTITEKTTEKRFPAKNNSSKNISNSSNTPVSGNKKEAPTHELIENSAPSTNDSNTSNNKSQDQNTSITQARHKFVISNDQSSTSRYMPQIKPIATTNTQTTKLPASESTTLTSELNQFSCKLKQRGRYADELDCRKFYICLGNKSSHIIEGTCPVNTVFSEINKQCTKNLSHCIRNNQFRCVTEGRFSDFLNDNVYYICIRNNLSHFIRFKLQCLNGYHLNKTSVRCVLNNESTSTSESKSGSEQSSSSIKQDTTEKPAKKFKCKKEGVFPDPSNCKKYFECTKVDSSFRQKKKKCDSGEIFLKDKKKCVDADSNEC